MIALVAVDARCCRSQLPILVMVVHSTVALEQLTDHALTSVCSWRAQRSLYSVTRKGILLTALCSKPGKLSQLRL